MSANPPTAQDHTEIVGQLTKDLLITSNLGQHVILTTEDKIRLAILEHLHHMEERHGWIAPLGLLVPILAAFVTAEFRDAVLTAAQWHALFIFSGLASFAWLIHASCRAWTAPTAEDFVNALKKKG